MTSMQKIPWAVITMELFYVDVISCQKDKYKQTLDPNKNKVEASKLTLKILVLYFFNNDD